MIMIRMTGLEMPASVFQIVHVTGQPGENEKKVLGRLCCSRYFFPSTDCLLDLKSASSWASERSQKTRLAATTTRHSKFRSDECNIIAWLSDKAIDRKTLAPSSLPKYPSIATRRFTRVSCIGCPKVMARMASL